MIRVGPDYFVKHRSARKDAAGNTAVADGQAHVDAASVGRDPIALNAYHIQDVCMDRVNDHGNVDANLAGPVICVTKSSLTAMSILILVEITLLASA